MNDAKHESMLMSVRDAAQWLGVSTRTVHRVIEAGGIKAIRTTPKSGVRWIVSESLRAFVAGGGVRKLS